MKRKLLGLSLCLLCMVAFLSFTRTTRGSVDFASKKAAMNSASVSKDRYDKVVNKVKDSWTDIKNNDTLKKIDLSEYFQVSMDYLPEFSQGQTKITDKQQIQSILKNTISPDLKDTPNGSLEPLILIKNDGNEVIFAYKKEDGKNVIKTHKLKDNKWESTSEKHEGKVPLTVE